MATNAQLSAQMNDLLTKWNVREDEMRAWLAGVPTGGPNNDGRYPLTNEDGTTYLIDCPAKLEDRVGGPTAEAELARQLAEAARDAALSHKDRAVTAETSAAASQVAAKDARDLAKLYRDEAAASHSNATVARTGAEAARDAAAASEANASASETNAKTSETNAKASEDAAAASAAAAATFNPSDFIRTTQRAVANGIATLDANGKIVTSQLPGLVLVDTYVVANEAGQLAAPAEQGDVVIRTDLQKSFIHTGGTAGTMADYQELLSPTDSVGSVDGRTGTVTLGDLYAAVVHGHAIADVSGLQAALDGKAPKASPVFSGAATFGAWSLGAGTASSMLLTTPTGTMTLGPRNASFCHFDTDRGGFHFYKPLQMEGGVYPYATAVIDLGTAYRKWRHVYASGDVSSGTVTTTGNATVGGALAVTGTITQNGTAVSLAGHTHAIADVTGLQSALNAKAEWNHGHNYSDLAGIPATFAPSPHTHDYLPLTGGTLTGQLAIRNGADSDGTPASAVQIGFQYRLGGGYEHRIVSKHNAGSSALNALDFYLWTPSTGSSMNAPTLKAMSLDAASGLTVASNLNVQGNRTDLRGQLFVNGTNPEIYLQGDANSYYPRIYFSTAYGANSSYLDAYNGGRWTSFNGAFSVAKTDGTITLSVAPSGSSLTGDLTVNSQNIFLKPDANNSLRLHHNGVNTYMDTTGVFAFRSSAGADWANLGPSGLTVYGNVTANQNLTVNGVTYAGFGSFGALRVTSQQSFDYASDNGASVYQNGLWLNSIATGHLGSSGNSIVDWTANSVSVRRPATFNAALTAQGYVYLNSLALPKEGFECQGVGGNSNAVGGPYRWGYQQAGTWASPNDKGEAYPDLILGYHTGIKIGAASGYGGVRFYADHPDYGTNPAMLMSVGNGDANVRVTNSLILGGYSTLAAASSNGALRLATAYGNAYFGPQNYSYCHMETDVPAFYFAQPVEFNGGAKRYGQGGYLHHASSSLGSGAITVSTAAPSGGADGDIWLQIS